MCVGGGGWDECDGARVVEVVGMSCVMVLWCCSERGDAVGAIQILLCIRMNITAVYSTFIYHTSF